MARDVKRKAGQYCPNCKKTVMAINDTSFMSGGGWYCPDCGKQTFGAIGQMLLRKAEQRGADKPKYNVTCPYCSTALVAPAGPRIKCQNCGRRLSVTPRATEPEPQAPSDAITQPVLNAIVPNEAVPERMRGSKAESESDRTLTEVMNENRPGAPAPPAKPGAGITSDVLMDEVDSDAMTAATSAPGRSRPTADPVSQIERLRDIRDAGDISAEEFESLKARVIAGPESSPQS